MSARATAGLLALAAVAAAAGLVAVLWILGSKESGAESPPARRPDEPAAPERRLDEPASSRGRGRGLLTDAAGSPLRWRWLRFTRVASPEFPWAARTETDGSFRVELRDGADYDVDLIMPRPPNVRDEPVRIARVRGGAGGFRLVSPR